MTLYFNRTLRKIFDDEDAKAYFYNAFFEEYNIDLLKCKYTHLHDDDVKGPYRSTTIFFKEEQIIVFKAILFGSNYLPDDGYEIEIYLKKDISLTETNSKRHSFLILNLPMSCCHTKLKTFQSTQLLTGQN